ADDQIAAGRDLERAYLACSRWSGGRMQHVGWRRRHDAVDVDGRAGHVLSTSPSTLASTVTELSFDVMLSGPVCPPRTARRRANTSFSISLNSSMLSSPSSSRI